MYNLKHTHNLIDHMVASVFITSDLQLGPHSNGIQKSSVKFGSYDQNALEEGTNL